MSIASDKMMNLADGQVLYNDLRRRTERNAGVIEEVLSTPAAVMSFDDGADGLPMKLIAAIEPVQDLHGYDNPWPAGGGKNLFGVADGTSGNAQVTVQSDGSVKINGTSSSSNNLYFNGTLSAGTYTLSCGFSGTLPSNSSARVDVYNVTDSVSLAAILNNDASTAKVTFTLASDASVRFRIRLDGGFNYSNVLLYPQLESGSSATSFAAYENICPITGWTGAEVTRTGKNLLGLGTMQNSVCNTNNKIAIDSNAIAYYFETSKLPDVITCSSINGNRAYVCYTNDVPASGVSCYGVDKTSQTVPKTIAVNKTYKYIHIQFAYNSSASNIQVEKGDTASIYETPGQTYSITFPSPAGTVYGGTLTVNQDGTGQLVVDRANVDLGTFNFEYQSSYSRMRATSLPTGIKLVDFNTRVGNLLCSIYKTWKAVSSESQDKTIAISNSSNPGLLIYDSAYTDESAFKTAMNGVQLVYELATPVTYPLTPGQVKTLLGVNNVWSNTGNIKEVQYPADTKIYVDNKVSAAERMMELIVTANREDEMKATRAYTSGNLLIVNGTLYKANTSIANGATLTVGTNVTATTVAAELAALA